MKRTRILILVIFLVFGFWTICDTAPTRYKLLSSDITVPINTTWVDVSNFTSSKLSLAYCEYASLTFYVKGNNAGCTKDVVIKFAAFDSKRDKWDTIAYYTENVTANGTTAVQKTIPLTPDVERIKLLSVQNQETTSGYTVDVNVSIFIK